MVSKVSINPEGRPPCGRKTGGRVKGSVQVQTKAVKEAVLRVFHRLNEADDYLTDIAESDRRLFLSLLAKLIPAEQNITAEVTTTHRIDLGAAMQEATARLAAAAAPLTIDHAPAAPAPATPAPPAQAEPLPYGPVRGAEPKPKPNEWDGY
jgi:hypothetical protein